MRITITRDKNGNTITRAYIEGVSASVTSDNIFDHQHRIAATITNRLAAKRGGYIPFDTYDKIRKRIAEKIGVEYI